MAYAAVVSLLQILKQLLHSDQYSLQYPNPQIKSLYHHLSSIQSSLEKTFPVPKSRRAAVNLLEIQIRDEIYRAQDTIESFISRETLSEQIPNLEGSISQDLDGIIAKVDPLAVEAKKIADSVGLSEKDGDWASENVVPSKSSAKSTKIVGQEKDLQLLMGELLKHDAKLQVVPIIGMPGIGKTTLAKSVYEDSRIDDFFYTRAWVTVSPEYNVGDIFFKLLSSMESMGQKSDVSDSMRRVGEKVSDEQLSLQLYQKLLNSRYLVVIDDMWDQKVWDKVRRSLPDNRNGSRIVLTTRIAQVADYAKTSHFRHVMQHLDRENSWKLLCEKVFGGGDCPPHLERLGRRIAENCRGLPLSITVVGGQLSQEIKTGEYWKIVEEDINAAAATSEEPYLEILSLSYSHLPGRLKGCFLYMGAFPEDSEIPVSKLIKLWVAEGFLTLASPSESVEQVAKQHLKDLIDRNLIIVSRFSSGGEIKTCGMHDVLRDLAVKESRKEMFFESISRSVEELLQGIETQRRLSVHRNILMCMEDVYHFTEEVKLARTIIYAGAHHHHPFPYRLTFDLLRVLDALTIYFIEFPEELPNLIHLRYLSLTYNGKLPPSISKLRNLQILIVRQHPRIVIVGSSILPVEIWNMPELRHLLFTESGFPGPSGAKIHASSSVPFANLQSLSNVHAACCTKEVLQNMPNLKKLGIWIEGRKKVHLYLDLLQQLEAFKFTVVNPIPESEIVFLPELAFPESLKRLTLSGCGIPWEEMAVIGQLPCLEVLKLRDLAFQGPEWRPNDEDFGELKFLLLESLDLENWDAQEPHFPSLERLIINHCYELEGIDLDLGNIGGLELIELVDCSSSAEASARKIRENQKEVNKGLQVRIYSSCSGMCKFLVSPPPTTGHIFFTAECYQYCLKL